MKEKSSFPSKLNNWHPFLKMGFEKSFALPDVIHSWAGLPTSMPAPEPSPQTPVTNTDPWGFDAVAGELVRIPAKKKSPKTGGTSYGHAHVLLLRWEADDTFKNETAALAYVFKQEFNCHTVKTLEIPSENSFWAVQRYLDTWVTIYSRHKTLLIVH